MGLGGNRCHITRRAACSIAASAEARSRVTSCVGSSRAASICRRGNRGNPPRRCPARRMTTRQYARLVSGWLADIGSDPHFSGRIRYVEPKQPSSTAAQLLLGHTKIESTVRYFGSEVDDALAIAEQVDV